MEIFDIICFFVFYAETSSWELISIVEMATQHLPDGVLMLSITA